MNEMKMLEKTGYKGLPVPAATPPIPHVVAPDSLPAGWTEAIPGGLATNPDLSTGGIVDRTIADGKWFVVFHRDDLRPPDGFPTRKSAFEAFHNAIHQQADARKVPELRYEQPVGFSVGGFVVGHMAKMNGNPNTATIVGLEDDDGRTKVIIEYAEPQPVDAPEGATSTRFEADWRTISSTWAVTAEDGKLPAQQDVNREFVSNNPNFPLYIMGHDGYLKAAFHRQDEAEQYARLDARRRVLTRSEVNDLLPEHRAKWVDIRTTNERDVPQAESDPINRQTLWLVGRAVFDACKGYADKGLPLGFVNVEAIVHQLCPPPYEATTVSLDEGPSYPAYSNGARWNGWQCPYFTHEVGLQVTQHPYLLGLSYNAEEDVFTFEDPENKDDPGYVADTYSPVTITVDGQPIKVYPIGAGSWCWNKG